jgi:uncharacterized protein YfkK (UPF0435 family)
VSFVASSSNYTASNMSAIAVGGSNVTASNLVSFVASSSNYTASNMSAIAVGGSNVTASNVTAIAVGGSNVTASNLVSFVASSSNYSASNMSAISVGASNCNTSNLVVNGGNIHITGSANTGALGGVVSLVPTLANASTLLIVGKSVSTNNSAYMAFVHSGADNSANNYLSLALMSGTGSMNINGAGNVGIGTTTPNVPLQFANALPGNRRITLFEEQNNEFQIYGFGISSSTLRYTVPSAGTDHVFFAGASSTAATELMRIMGTGSVSIPGTLSKGGGTFDIAHPTVEGKRLVHSFVEGPRCDLMYRGVANLTGGAAEINIDLASTSSSDCAMTEGTFAALCANPQVFLQNEDGYARIKGKVLGNILTIACEDVECSDLISWMVVAERKDALVKAWDRTNSDGFLVTEYTRDPITV